MKRIFYALMVIGFGAMGTAAAQTDTEATVSTVIPDSIIVTANRFGLSEQNSVWPARIVRPEALENQASLQAALDGTAGLDIRTYNGTGSLATLSNWGLYNRHVLLLYNGRAVKDYSLGGFNLSDFSVEELERVEILKGPQSAFYGADAVGGVVNLISPGTLVDRLKLTTRLGTDNLQIYGLSFARRIGRIGLGGYAEFNSADNSRPNAGSERILLNLRSDYLSNDSRHRVWLAARYFNDSLGVPGPQPADGFIPVYGSSESYSLFDHQKDENYSLDLQYRFDDDRVGNLQVDLFWEKKNLDYNSLYNYQFNYLMIDSSSVPHDSVLNTDAVDVHARTLINKRSSGINARYMKRLSNLTVAGGIDWLSGSINSTTSDKNEAANIVGPFAPFEYSWDTYNFWYGSQNQFDLWSNSIYRLTSKVQLDLSGRIQFIKNRQAQPSYNLGLIHAPAECLSLKIGYAYAYRLPSIADQFAEDVYTAGNDKLGPETSRSIIGSVSLSPPESSYRAGLTFFHQTVDSLTQYQLDLSSYKYVPRNVDKMRTTGLDFNFDLSIVEQVTLTWSGVWQKAEQTVNSGQDYVDAFYVPELKWRADVAGAWHRISGGINLSHTSDRSILTAGEEKTLAGVYELGLTAVYKMTSAIQLSLTAYDLTDEQRPDQFGFSIYDGDYPTPGRRFVLGASWSLP